MTAILEKKCFFHKLYPVTFLFNAYLENSRTS